MTHSTRSRRLLVSLAAAIGCLGVFAVPAQAIKIKAGWFWVNTNAETRAELESRIRGLESDPRRFLLTPSQVNVVADAIRGAIGEGEFMSDAAAVLRDRAGTIRSSIDWIPTKDSSSISLFGPAKATLSTRERSLRGRIQSTTEATNPTAEQLASLDAEIQEHLRLRTRLNTLANQHVTGESRKKAASNLDLIDLVARWKALNDSCQKFIVSTDRETNWQTMSEESLAQHLSQFEQLDTETGQLLAAAFQTRCDDGYKTAKKLRNRKLAESFKTLKSLWGDRQNTWYPKALWRDFAKAEAELKEAQGEGDDEPVSDADEADEKSAGKRQRDERTEVSPASAEEERSPDRDEVGQSTPVRVKLEPVDDDDNPFEESPVLGRVKLEPLPAKIFTDNEIRNEVRVLAGNLRPNQPAVNCTQLCNALARFLITGEKATAAVEAQAAPFWHFPEEFETVRQQVKVETRDGAATTREVRVGKSKGVHRSDSPEALAHLIPAPTIGFVETSDGALSEVIDIDQQRVLPVTIHFDQLQQAIIDKLKTSDRVVALVGINRLNRHAQKAGHVNLVYGYRDADGNPVVRFLEPQDPKEVVHTNISGIGTFLQQAKQSVGPDIFSPNLEVYFLFAPFSPDGLK